MTDLGWIIINRWDDFQHVDVKRGSGPPPWIKTYVRLMQDDAYMNLSLVRALMLHRLWLAYAQSRSRLRADTRQLSYRLNLRVRAEDLEALSHAGFITIVASNMQADLPASRKHLASTEEEEEEEETVTVTPPLSKTTSARDEAERGDGDGDDWDEGLEEGKPAFNAEQYPHLERDNGVARLSPQEVLAAQARGEA